MRFLVGLSLLGTAFAAQRPPVILVDGYHLECSADNLKSTQDFGELQQRLEAEGVEVYYLPTCSFPTKPPIEDIGRALGALIQSLNVPEVDLITHSMGGLVARSYLSGKSANPAGFNPPADPKVRKWVSIATPNFGALIPDIIGQFAPDEQVRELSSGSQFIFDLATWNQNQDDLRGIDAIALVGNAANFGPITNSTDGTVAVTSASLSFARPDERTRVLPYCHGIGSGVSFLGLGCSAPPLANIEADNPLSWQIIDSFLAGRDDWKTIGHTPLQDALLSRYGGILRQQRDANDNVSGSLSDLPFVPGAAHPGTYQVVIEKSGPQIALVAPSAARLPYLSLAPRMLISIYGNSLDQSTVTFNGQSLALNYVSEHQVNALLPTDIGGLGTLQVVNGSGSQTVNVMVEPTAPAVFSKDGSGTGTAAAIRNGNDVSLFLTGLGSDGVQPSVAVDGSTVAVTYSGPAPGFAGLDQINIQIPAGVASGTVVVSSGRRSSNPVLLP
jgi:uncharacterized protein (TIGR03437 family)